MKKLNFLEKLGKNELKQIKAGEGGTRNGGSNNDPTPGGGNCDTECGIEPGVCFSTAWYTWHTCMVNCHDGALPLTQCH